jgi:hypothetical protein
MTTDKILPENQNMNGRSIMVPESKTKNIKVIIVGGVAGGASCAARLRRLDENAEILMVERGLYVSPIAGCHTMSGV